MDTALNNQIAKVTARLASFENEIKQISEKSNELKDELIFALKTRNTFLVEDYKDVINKTYTIRQNLDNSTNRPRQFSQYAGKK